MPKKSSAKKSSKKAVRAVQKARPAVARKAAPVRKPAAARKAVTARKPAAARKAVAARRKESPDKYAQSGAPWWKQHLPD